MLQRITLLAPARTASQRRNTFAGDDDEIEDVAEADAMATLDAIGANRAVGADGAVGGGPERRVAQTAAALGLTVSVCPELAAWPSGSWTGRTIDEVAIADARAFEAWRTDPRAGAPGGESLLALLERVAAWLDATPPESRTTVVADGSVVRALAVHALGAEASAFWRMDVEPLSVTRLRGDGVTWRVRSLGEQPRRPAPVNRGPGAAG